MTWRKKLVLLMSGAIGVSILMVTACSPAPGQFDVQGEEERTISVNGSGAVTTGPDEVVVRVGVETMAETARQALARNSEQMENVVQALSEMGIPDEDVQTQTVDLSPEYDESGGREPGEPRRLELVGYRASNTVEVRSEDLGAVGQLLDATVAAGANRVEGIRFEVSNASELLGRAREGAWQDAREKAEQLAGLAGDELGDVVSISESTGVPRPVELEAAAERGLAVPIEPGTEEVRVDLSVTWALR